MKKYFIVLKKELLDCFRDKRSLVMMVLPLLLFPILLSFYNQQTESSDKSLSEQMIIASETKTELDEIAAVLSNGGAKIEVVEVDDPASELKSGKVVLILNKDEAGYHIVFNQTSIKSSKAMSIVCAGIETLKTAQICAVFNIHGESLDVLTEYSYTFEDISTSEESGTPLLSALGPMMIIMFIASGGSSMALDMFCGEKERGSLEGILSTQINRKPLYFAKVTTVFVFACLSTLISIGGYIISFLLEGNNLLDGNAGFSKLQITLLFIVASGFAFFTSAIISALSISAKTVKEGSLRTGLYTIVPSIIGGVSTYLETGTASAVTAVIPIINIIYALKSIFIDTIEPMQLIITVVSTVAYGIGFLLIGYWIINGEKVLSK